MNSNLNKIVTIIIQIMKKVSLISLVVLLVATVFCSCNDVTGMQDHIVVVETTDDNTSYEVKYVSEIKRKNVTYAMVKSSDKLYMFGYGIYTFTTGNEKIQSEVDYTLTRVLGNSECKL